MMQRAERAAQKTRYDFQVTPRPTPRRYSDCCRFLLIQRRHLHPEAQRKAQRKGRAKSACNGGTSGHVWHLQRNLGARMTLTAVRYLEARYMPTIFVYRKHAYPTNITKLEWFSFWS